MSIQTRSVGEGDRWLPNVRRKGQLEEGLLDLIWPASMATDEWFAVVRKFIGAD